MRDTYCAHRAPPPSSSGAVHRVDEPASGVLRHRTDRLAERATGRRGREGHALTPASDSHRAVDHGYSPREDRKIRQRVRKCAAERVWVEMALEEEDNVDGEVRDNGVADIAADVEPLRRRWFDQLGRHRGLPSPVHDYQTAEFRGVGDSPEMHLLIGG